MPADAQGEGAYAEALRPCSRTRAKRFAYSTIALFWTVVFGFIEHLYLRHQMDMARFLGISGICDWQHCKEIKNGTIDDYEPLRK